MLTSAEFWALVASAIGIICTMYEYKCEMQDIDDEFGGI